MQFEWDENKNQLNRQKHLLDFGDAAEVLNNTHFIYEDNRRDYGEIRYIALGNLQKRIVVLVYTKRADIYRIISMRKANDKEKKIYQDRFESAG